MGNDGYEWVSHAVVIIYGLGASWQGRAVSEGLRTLSLMIIDSSLSQILKIACVQMLHHKKIPLTAVKMSKYVFIYK